MKSKLVIWLRDLCIRVTGALAIKKNVRMLDQLATATVQR